MRRSLRRLLAFERLPAFALDLRITRANEQPIYRSLSYTDLPLRVSTKPSSTLSPSTLLPYVLGAALAEALLSTMLGLLAAARLRQGAAPHHGLLLALAVVTAGWWLTWTQRQRWKPLVSTLVGAATGLVAIGVILITQVPLRPLVLASQVLPVARHALALLSAALILAWAWHNQPSFLRPRWQRIATVVPTLAALLALLLAHGDQLVDVPASTVATAQMFGVATLLVIFLGHIAIARAVWEQRLLLVCLVAPLLVRIMGAWPLGLVGAPVAEEAQAWLLLTFVGATATVLLLEWPVLGWFRLLLVASSAGVTCWALLDLYVHRWGHLESQLAPLVVRYLGFIPPYPELVAVWAAPVLLVGIFFAWFTTVALIGLPHRRARGYALALLGLSGLGLSSPATALATLAALFAHLAHARADEQPALSGIPDLSPFFLHLASMLSPHEPVMVVDGTLTIGRLQGRVATFALEVRFEQRHGFPAACEVRLGTLASQPLARLFARAGQSGRRPAHPIAITHAMEGETERIERLPEDILDGLRELPAPEVQLFAAGCVIRLTQLTRSPQAAVLHRIIQGLASDPS